jgi:hypothetical protein
MKEITGIYHIYMRQILKKKHVLGNEISNDCQFLSFHGGRHVNSAVIKDDKGIIVCRWDSEWKPLLIPNINDFNQCYSDQNVSIM